MTNKDERIALLDFFRTQINTHAEIIVSLIIALFSQGVAIYFLPGALTFLKFPLILGGLGFFGGLIVLQWFKLFWYARLWNATLIAPEKPFQDFFGRESKVAIEETPILKIYLGAHKLWINACKKRYAVFMYLSLPMKYQFMFSTLIGSILGLLPFSLASIFGLSDITSNYYWLQFLILIPFIGLVILLLWVLFKCRSTAQIKEWLKPHDLEQLVGL